LNKVIAINTQKKAAEKAADAEELLHNPARMKQILVHVLKNAELKSIQADLLSLTHDEFKEKHHKDTPMNFLKSHLLMEGKSYIPIIQYAYLSQFKYSNNLVIRPL
jgi:hypothetical protein